MARLLVGRWTPWIPAAETGPGLFCFIQNNWEWSRTTGCVEREKNARVLRQTVTLAAGPPGQVLWKRVVQPIPVLHPEGGYVALEAAELESFSVDFSNIRLKGGG